jgi:hypothetical protein
MFAWAVGENRITASPAAGVKKRVKEEERDRVLSDDELVSKCAQISLYCIVWQMLEHVFEYKKIGRGEPFKRHEFLKSDVVVVPKFSLIFLDDGRNDIDPQVRHGTPVNVSRKLPAWRVPSGPFVPPVP